MVRAQQQSGEEGESRSGGQNVREDMEDAGEQTRCWSSEVQNVVKGNKYAKKKWDKSGWQQNKENYMQHKKEFKRQWQERSRKH